MGTVGRGAWAVAITAVILLCLPAAGSSRTAPVTIELGYASHPMLAAFLRRAPVHVVRIVPALRIAEVRTDGPAGPVLAAARRAAGIRFARPTVERVSAAVPALALGAVSAPAGGAYEWQYYATGMDRVPASVLAAARGITIGVVDTGADLGASGLAAKTVGIYDPRTGSRNVADTSGHGTFVASLAAGAVTNGGGIAGFGGDARLLVVKAGTDDRFNDVDVAAGIVYAAQHGARIVNISVTGSAKSPVEVSAVQYAARHDVLLVAAAGNDAQAGNLPKYPAALLQPVGSNGIGGSGLAVGASDFAGARAPFSEHGSFLSMAAPGVSVFGALPAGGTLPLFQRTPLPGATGGAYGFASGTSFAAPEVAGAAALVWAANPRLKAAAVASLLERTAGGNGAWGPELGFGVLNVAAAVAAARAGA